MKIKNIGLFAGIISALVILIFFNFDEKNPNVTRMAAVASLMAIWWITEAVPLAATSLLPIVLFPLFGIEKGDATAATYFNSTIFLFLGGFLIALAMEKWNFHKRIALKIILLFGGNSDKIIFGFMCASAFLSMWISNTATAVMMFPIGLSIILKLEESFSYDQTHNFSVALMIGIAYSCSIGGITTVIGTPPNLSFIRIIKIIFPESPDISFGEWIQLILPISVTMLLSAWFVLTKIIFKTKTSLNINRSLIKNEYLKLGKITFEEKAVGVIFTITALLWIFRGDMQSGFIEISGWSNLFPYPDYINDGTIAIAMSSLLFIVPSKQERILGVEVFSKIPWDIILLFGGGFALAKGFVVSGLSDFIGSGFAGLSVFPPLLIMLMTGLVITFMTELTSNTATAEMMLPVLASISLAIGINPLFLMLNGTISASMAFMLPVATPPNAVVFGSRRIRIIDMVKGGFILNLTGAIIITLILFFWGSYLFNADLTQVPNWVK